MIDLDEVYLVEGVRSGGGITDRMVAKINPRARIEKLCFDGRQVLLRIVGHKTRVIPLANVVDFVPCDDPLTDVVETQPEPEVLAVVVVEPEPVVAPVAVEPEIPIEEPAPVIDLRDLVTSPEPQPELDPKPEVCTCGYKSHHFAKRCKRCGLPTKRGQ